jgi:hypothetical protein
VAWRPDSQGCAVGAGEGWAIAWPGRRRLEWVHRLPAPGPDTSRSEESCAAWSPSGRRLAIFESEGGTGLYLLWDGERVAVRERWARAWSLPPDQGPWRAWQCEWSPDEGALLFRYFEHFKHQRENAGYLAVVDPETGERRGGGVSPAGPARWLDAARIAFRGDDDGIAFEPVPLFVADPAGGTRKRWLPDVVAWALSPRRDTLWALTRGGKLTRSPTAAPAWKPLPRPSLSPEDHGFQIALSPDGGSVALWRGVDDAPRLPTLVTVTPAPPPPSTGSSGSWGRGSRGVDS